MFDEFYQFASLFCKPGEIIIFRAWGERIKTLSAKEFKADLEHLAELYPILLEHNKQGYAIAMIINKGGRVDKEINRIAAFYYENDEIDKDSQMEMAKRLPPPSAVVDTKRSRHIYYLCDETAKVCDNRRIQKKLSQVQHSDGSIVNPSHPMRCPGGLFHLKTSEPYPCRLLECHPERVYDQQEFEAILDSLLAEEGGSPEGSVVPAADDEEEPAREDEKGTLTQLDFMCSECLFIQHCKKNAGILSEPDWLGMITNMAVFEGGPERIHEYSRGYPRYSVDETNRKIEHFLTSSTKPMRCETLAEKGFVCPKLKEGGCPGAKAPAALPFKLKDVEVNNIDKMKWYHKTKDGLALSRGVLAEVLKN